MTSRSMDVTQGLSLQLRVRTENPHGRIEAVLALPGAIRSGDDSANWLGRFFGLCEPLELLLASFSDWGSLRFFLQPRSHTSCLTEDRVALAFHAWFAPFCAITVTRP